MNPANGVQDMISEKTHPQERIFRANRLRIIIMIILALSPSVSMINAGNKLLLGLFLSVCMAWLLLSFSKLKWSDVGLKKFKGRKRFILTVTIILVSIILFSWGLRHLVTFLLKSEPNLEAFKALKGDPGALMTGLVIAWFFGAFCEEMLFRGFLLNAFYGLFGDNLNSTARWVFSLLIVSTLTGLGHAYQGITGMIVAGAIGFCFGLVYLYNNRNLWPSILTHGIYDTIAFVIVFLGFNLDQVLKF